MIKKSILVSLLLTVFFCFLTADYLTKGSEELNEVFPQIEGTTEMIYVYVVMAEQYDTDKLYNEVNQLSRPERREITVTTLQDFSSRTQANLRSEIELLKKSGLVSDVHYLWITNIIGMKASAEALKTIENHPDIEVIQYDPYIKMIDDTNLVPSDAADNQDMRQGDRSNRNVTDRDVREHQTREITYNVERVRAPQVWEQGHTGQGIVVAVIDTGVNYNHHDIRNQMWQHPDYPHHGYNWVENNTNTMDFHSHGTHCAGTVAGNGASGSQTGVAPNATIMALKTLSDEGSGNSQHNIAAFQFAVQHGADVLSCSFGAMGANALGRRSRREALNNVLAAGVIASISAGNSGEEQAEHPIPRNIGSPSDCPPPWLHPAQTLLGGRSAVVSVGAIDSADRIASFSSRGPTTWADVFPFNDYAYNPGMGLIKPDVVAPGVSIKSLRHNNNTGYIHLSGTSMSGPAVSGVLALMLSKDPSLRPERLAQILEETADPLSPTKNNTFGSGCVNVQRALTQIKYVEIESFTVSGDTEIPQYGQTVTISLRMKNTGTGEATNISGTLSSDDDYVTILQSEAQMGNINAGQSVNIPDAFTVRIADNIPHEHQIVFALHISPGNDQYHWYDYFSMEVNAPQLSTSVLRVFDPAPGGNNNGIIEPGEEITVYIPVSNTGGATSPAADIAIISTGNMANILELNDAHFSFIKKGESMYPSMRVAVSNQAEYGSVLPFLYTFTTGNYEFEGQLSLLVGGSIEIQLGQGETITQPTVASPINIYFRALRSQTVYTAEELYAAGASASIPITSIGYYVASAPTQQLPNFLIRMRHTQATDAARHISGPYTTVFGPTNHRPTANRWDMIDLTTSFIWNGTDNILVDTVFQPVQAWDSSGQIRVYNLQNGFRYIRQDAANLTDVNTAEASNDKPQIKMVFEIAEGNDPYAPDNLIAQLDDDRVQLVWDAPDGNPLGYNVFRNGVKLNTNQVTNTFYSDGDLIPSASYFYYVTAVYTGFESSPSGIATFRGVAAPQFNPPGGIKSNPFMLSITSYTPDTEIYYTLDGEIPDSNSILFDEPFLIDNHITVTAIAYKAGLLHSVIAEAEYYFLNQPLNLSVQPAVNFAYLTWDDPEFPEEMRNDGSRPAHRRNVTRNASNTRSFLGFNLYRSFNSDNLVKINPYLIMEDQYFDSELATGRYTYAVSAVYDDGESEKTEPVIAYVGIVGPPIFTPAAGEYNPPVEVSLHTLTTTAVIRYTTNGTFPNTSSRVYTGEPIIVEDNMTIRAYATRAGWQQSAVSTAIYTIVTTDVEEEVSAPLITKLHNAFPNPFNPETAISFSLKDDDYVQLAIYNIAGQLVNNLVQEKLQRGVYRFVWAGTTNNGTKTSSGIYFYRLTTSDYLETKKVLLLK